MKKKLYFLFFLSCFINAQNKQVLYDFAGLPQTLMLNPGAKVDNKWYAGFPLFSQVSVKGGFTAFSVYDIFSVNGENINTKIANQIQHFGKTEFIEANQQLEVFSGGFQWKNDMYVSFGYYQEFDFLAKIPRDIIDLSYYGNIDLNRHYSVNKLTARAELLGVFHAGISKKIAENWQVGTRFKLYSSAFNLYSKANKGSLVTTNGTTNIYEQQLQQIDILLQTAGLVLPYGTEADASYFVNNMLLGGSLGLGIDVGFTHQYNEKWEVSGSALDLGFVYHTNDVNSYQIKGDYTTEGIDLIFDDTDDPADYWQNIVNEFNEDVVLDTITSNYMTFRPLKLYGALSYSFGNKLDDCRFNTMPGFFVNKVGAQLFAAVGAVKTYAAATLFYEHFFNKYFQTKLTYTIDPFSFYNIGLGISTQFGPVNLYVIADNLAYLSNLYAAKSASIQVGINVIFYKK
jgi:hypothetical protein